ncbi:hypothetical protein QCE63_24505 [Caballeronia sp. LZ065]|uniref:hypothetical protein n=1 Tax=Caballeronia sp. LZ065 TaxID=3038571 RepID=UPI00285F9135|nr:hypothetical protein [Caballeronia sp. LZ065]MDR5782570.1 hypothetical protein [Caballeronia sp. LZ065]
MRRLRSCWFDICCVAAILCASLGALQLAGMLKTHPPATITALDHDSLLPLERLWLEEHAGVSAPSRCGSVRASCS